jgi:ribosome-binding factor A
MATGMYQKGFSRADRVASQLQRELADIIRTELKADEPVDVSIGWVKLSRDLSHARVFVDSLFEDRLDGMIETLNESVGFLRSRLGKRMRLRTSPLLVFARDDSQRRGAHIDSLLAEAKRKDNGDSE